MISSQPLSLLSVSLLFLSIVSPLSLWAMDGEDPRRAAKAPQRQQQQAAPAEDRGAAGAAAASAQQVQPDLQFALQALKGGNGGAAVELIDQPPYKKILAIGRARRAGVKLAPPQRPFALLPVELFSKILLYICAVPGLPWEIFFEDDRDPSPWHAELSKIRKVCWHWRDATLTNFFRRDAILNSWNPETADNISSYSEWLPRHVPRLEHALIAMRSLRFFEWYAPPADTPLPKGLGLLLKYSCEKLQLPYAFWVRNTFHNSGRILTPIRFKLLQDHLQYPGWPKFKREYFFALLRLPISPTEVVYEDQVPAIEARLRGLIDTFAADDKCPIQAYFIAKRLSMRTKRRDEDPFLLYPSEPEAILEDLRQLNVLIRKGDPEAVLLVERGFASTLSFESFYGVQDDPAVIESYHDKEALNLVKTAGGLAVPPETQKQSQADSQPQEQQQNKEDEASASRKNQSEQGDTEIVEDEDFETAVLRFWREKELERIRRMELKVASQVAASLYLPLQVRQHRPYRHEMEAAALGDGGAAAAAVVADSREDDGAAAEVEAPEERKKPQ